MLTKLKIGLVIASVAFISAAFLTPAYADLKFEIAGNGSRSDNRIDVDVDKRLDINQENDTDIDNNVTIHNITGFNNANDNTGGDVSIETGDAIANVEIINVAGKNIAKIDSCGCDEDFRFHIDGNGSRSDNEISFDLNKSTDIHQDNDTNIDNNVDVHNITGFNTASDNTGDSHHDWDKKDDHRDNHDNKHDDKKDNHKDSSKDHHDFDRHGHDGDISIKTGDAKADVAIFNSAGVNFLSI